MTRPATSQEKAAQVRPPRPKATCTPAGGETIGKTFDWDYYRDKFVAGGMTLQAISELPHAPALGTLKNYCASQKWESQREKYREKVVTKTREAVATTEADIAARHVKMAQALQAKALQALQQVDVSKLPPSEIRQFLATATDIERKALGMDNKFTLKGVGDVSKLSDADLLALARRAGVLGDSETGGFTA